MSRIIKKKKIRRIAVLLTVTLPVGLPLHAQHVLDKYNYIIPKQFTTDNKSHFFCYELDKTKQNVVYSLLDDDLNVQKTLMVPTREYWQDILQGLEILEYVETVKSSKYPYGDELFTVEQFKQLLKDNFNFESLYETVQGDTLVYRDKHYKYQNFSSKFNWIRQTDNKELGKFLIETVDVRAKFGTQWIDLENLSDDDATPSFVGYHDSSLNTDIRNIGFTQNLFNSDPQWELFSYQTVEKEKDIDNYRPILDIDGNEKVVLRFISVRHELSCCNVISEKGEVL